MAEIAGSVRHLWAAVIVRLEMMGLPAETAPAILAAIAIGILIARYRYAKRRSAGETADEPTRGAVRSTSATSSPTHTGGGETGGGDDIVATARTIEGYCDAAHWRCTRNDDVVHMKFPGANDTEQIVFVNSFPSIVEVVGLLPFSYVDLDDAPHDLSNTLMKLNASRKSAFWAIYDFGEDHYYCLIDNIPISRLNQDRVLTTVKTVRAGCIEMVTALVEAAEEV